MHPTPEDWMTVGNDLRITLGLPLMTEPTRCPTDAELADYDIVLKGAANVLRKMAHEQMLHRKKMEASR